MSSVGIEEEGNQPNSFTPKTQVKNIIQELARTEKQQTLGLLDGWRSQGCGQKTTMLALIVLTSQGQDRAEQEANLPVSQDVRVHGDL